jgi:predicted Zn-dependent protease with MMP-like domain
LLDDREEDKRRLDKLEAAHRLSEVTTKLADLNTDKFVFPPAFADEMRNALVQLNEKSAEKVIEALKGLMKTGIVELGERGSNKPRDTGDAVKKFTDRIAELQKDNKELSYREAVDNIGRNEPELWEAYSEATLREVQTG